MPWSDPQPTGDAAASGPARVRAREGQAAALLGWFHLALAVPVFAGIGFARLAIDRMLNLLAALTLVAVGVFFLWWARRLARRPLPPEPS
jgi:hypothetical protein